MFDISPNDHMDPTLSLILMALISIGFLFVIFRAFREVAQWRRRGRAADDGINPITPLTEGDSLVQGVVELDEGTDYAVIVEVRQQGRERKGSKGGWTHRWTERGRRTFTNPFWIRHASGERVRVEPGEKVQLVDRLDILVHDEPTERFHIAELSAGETVIAEGVLTSEASPAEGQGYRTASPRTWRIRQTHEARLHLTAEKLGDHYRRMGNFYVKQIIFAWLPLMLIAAGLFGPFVGRMLMGEPSTISIASKNYHPPHGKTGASWSVSFLDPRGEWDSASLDEDDWDTLSQGDTMAYIDVPSLRQISCLGVRSSLHVFGFIIALIILLVCMAMLFTPPTKPWYRSKGWNEHGGGRLKKPKPSTRHVYSRDS